ncbi:MAG: family 78 glycoside hydrolase catalytic domain [candidate division Zixibacteria bacterium]|nr:family 78 glycoside hydrolase catalytic domain [candidate division Zixibacteria bacterium]
MKRKKLPKRGTSLLHGRNAVILLMLFVSCTAIQTDDDAIKLKNDTMIVVGKSSSSENQASLSTTSIVPTDLRCEYLTNPLGIDVNRPRLSWKLKATEQKTRGQAQRAYHILVASSEELLAQDRGDLWDSGEIESDQSNLVIYRGSVLSSGKRCYWKVRVRDNHGVFSGWSESARWTMGLLNPPDWSAKWIGTKQQFVEVKGLPPEGNYLSDPWFRKEIILREKPWWATIYVASVGYHELYVNGKKVTDAVLMPSVADHTKRALYVTYEIADHLRPGRNVIGLWLGTSWSIYPLYKTDDKPQTPIVIAQAHIEMKDGQSQRFITDETWKTHPSPNVLLGTWMFTNFGGEYYDANKELTDWCSTNLDDSSWKPATVYHPKLLLSAQMVEPNRRIGKIKPIAIEKIESGGYRADMGVNFAGFVELDVKGQQGDIIELQSSERKEKLITHRLRSAYRIGPGRQGTFRSRFNYGSGRWILIKGLGYKPALQDIRGYLVRTDFQRAGWFECSNKMLNDIYNIVLWTFENLSLGGYVVDCPQRERMGYGGDAHATTQTALNNYNLGAFYTKWTQDWRDVQGKDTAWGLGERATNQNAPTQPGNLPYTAPTYWGGGGPAWSGICVTLPWYVYRHYGDIRILEENFETIERWLAFLETKSKNNMLVRWGGEWDFLGDWLWPGAQGVNGDTRETLFFNNCYWIYNLQTSARIAGALGKKDVAARYRSRAAVIARAVHKEFFNPQVNGYVNNLQAYLAIALLVGLPPEEIRPAVWKRFEDEILIHRKGHFWGGITGGYFVVKNLLEFDRPDLLFEMATKKDYPGWGDMLQRGATTLWEAWDGSNSRLHSSYLHIGAWFIEGLGGIKPDPDSPGYKHFLIKPGVLRNQPLDWVKARLESPYGTIRSEWRILNGKLKLMVSVPLNTTATLYLPTKDPKSIKEGNVPIAQANGIKHLRDTTELSVLEIQPGHYNFEAAL